MLERERERGRNELVEGKRESMYKRELGDQFWGMGGRAGVRPIQTMPPVGLDGTGLSPWRCRLRTDVSG